MNAPKQLLCSLSLAAAMTGCRQSDDPANGALGGTPAQAASFMEEAFKTADPMVRQNAQTAADALRQGDFERAVVALETMRSDSGVTLDQGLAIHHSSVALESRLVQAIEAGDANARRAYDLLKKSKRK